MYIDPNDPQAAALLQQAGLTIADDGTVIGGIEEGVQVQEGVQDDSQASEVITADPPTDNQLGTIMEGADNASTEVPQELFMSSDELEVKPGLTLDANEHKIAEDLGAALVRLFKYVALLNKYKREYSVIKSIFGHMREFYHIVGWTLKKHFC